MRTIRTHPLPIHTETAYRELFEGADEKSIRGEASTLYLYSRHAPERIARRSPDAHIVALLRHPVDRAYSQFLHHVRDTHETTTDFVQALENEEDRLHRGPFWHYRRVGLYYEQLKRYYEYFPGSQIRVYLLEDFAENEERVWKDLLDFLKVDSAVGLPETKKTNATGLPQNPLLHRMLSLPWRFPVLREIVQRIPKTVRDVFSSIRRRNLSKPELSADVRLHLTSRYFVDDIRALQELIGRDLSDWLVKNTASKNQ